MGKATNLFLSDAASPKQWKEVGADTGVGLGFTASGLRRIEPAPIVADQKLAAQTRLQRPQYEIGTLIDRNRADIVVFNPRAARGDFAMQGEIRLRLSMDPDKSADRAAFGFDNIELVQYHSPADCVAADQCASFDRRASGRPQDAFFQFGDAVISCAQFDPACAKSGLFNPLSEL